MEPFSINGFIGGGGGGQELSGNESGWTKYIASPSYEDNYASIVVDGDDGNMANNYHASHQGYHHRSCYNMIRDYQIDDDITSDASSGPSYHEMMMVSSAGGMMTSFDQGSVEGEEYTSCRNWFNGEKKPYHQRDEDEVIKRKGKATGKVSKSDQGKRTTSNSSKRGKKIFSG